MSLHSIRTMSLEVNCAGKSNSLALLEETSAWAHDTLVPQIERIFDSLPESKEHIRIERLEIELNSTNPASWRGEILDKLKRDLTAILAARIPVRRELSAGDETLSTEESFFVDLVFFLQNGVLPWSSAIRSRNEWDEGVSEWFASIRPDDYRLRFIDVLAAPSARFRFIQSVSLRVLHKTMTVFFGVPERLWSDWVVDVGRIRWTEASKQVVMGEVGSVQRRAADFLLVALSRNLFEMIANRGFTYERDSEIQVVAQALAERTREQQIRLEDLQSLEFVSPSFMEARQIVHETSFEAGTPLRRRSTLDADAFEKHASSMTRPAGHAQVQANRMPGERPTDVDVAAGIYVGNAGAVLLAPFLTTFFDRVGISKDSQLVDAGMAMVLIHYLATGQESVVEFQLALPKILCGWEIEQDVELPEAVPDEMKEEAGKLLSSMIEHWSILKNTSPAGLRESFLQRSGKLSLTERNDWLLQVEKKSFDMVLQHLPWSFQFVKLPWMTRLLRTEWVY